MTVMLAATDCVTDSPAEFLALGVLLLALAIVAVFPAISTFLL